MSDDSLILLLLKINRGNWLLQSEELVKDIYWIMDIWSWQFLWPLDYILDDPHYHTFIWHHLRYFACIWYHLHNYIFVTCYCHCLHCPVILKHYFHCMILISMIMIDLSGIHYLLLIFLISILDHTHWVTHYLALHWLMKLTKPGLIGETVAGEIQGGVLGRATPYGFGCYTWSCYLCVLLLLHVTWYLSTVNCFSLLSGSTITSLV